MEKIKNLLFSIDVSTLIKDEEMIVCEEKKKVYLPEIKKINLKAQNNFFLPVHLILDKMNCHLIPFFLFFLLNNNYS